MFAKLAFSSLAVVAAILPFCSATASEAAAAATPIVSTYTFTNPYIYESYVDYEPYLIEVTTNKVWTQTRTFAAAPTVEAREHARDFRLD
ncbi:hypothetical protein NLI96_g1903 [Meripilus lineatus]|uniref:Uncharacterized protein n=1 Tax=Meripilus lineatus TaxID=2056292 RepID=A0AAD5YMF1_9APHY|nr:hypothetical protein NLI96_g1903 [Physisporinus lineatus]